MDINESEVGPAVPSAPADQLEASSKSSVPLASNDKPDLTIKNDKDTKDDKINKGVDKKATSKVDTDDSPFKLGENTISMPLVYESAYGDLSPDVAPDVLTELLAKISRRHDLVQDNEMDTQIIGHTSIESERIAYRGVQSTAFWDKYYPEGTFPRHTYRIHFDSGVVVHELNPVLTEDYTRGGTVDSKMVASQMRGELPANRIVAEMIAFLLNDSLVVFDLQYVYCIGHLMQFKLRDAELSADAVVEWHAIENTIEFINMDPDQAQVNASILAFTNAVTRQDLIVLSKNYSDEDINVMRMIATGTQSMTLSVRGRRHVADNFVSDQLKFVMIGTMQRVMPPFAPPTIDEISAFMHKFALDFKTHLDGVKGFTKACSIYFGRVLTWRVDDGVITSLCGPYTAPNDPDHQERNFRMPGSVGNGIPQPRDRERVNHVPSFDERPARAQAPPAPNRLAAMSQSMRELNVAKPTVPYNGKMVDKRALQKLLQDNTALLKTALAANNHTNVEICTRKGIEIKAALAQLPGSSRSEAASLPSSLDNTQPIPGPSEEQPDEAEEAAPVVTYGVDWLPASLEMGATSVPQPHGFNIMWRILRLCNDMKTHPWMAREVKTWTSIPRNDITRLGAVLANMLTLGQSYSLHVANFTATQLRRFAAADDANSRGGLLFLLNAKDAQAESALIATNTCYFISRTFGLTMNPQTYFINQFSFTFIGPREYTPGSAYELWCGARMIYLQHPLSMAWAIEQFPSIWGIAAPGITVDLQNDVNLYLDTNDRGWYSDLGCKDYVSQFSDHMEFQYVPYAISVLNALWQHYNIQGVPPGTFVRYYARAGQTANLMRTRRYLRLAWDPSTASFAIGSLVTYDWNRKEALALNLSGADAVQTILRYMQDIRPTSLDAGYRVDRIIRTHIPNTTGQGANMLGLYKGRRHNEDDNIDKTKIGDDRASRRAGN